MFQALSFFASIFTTITMAIDSVLGIQLTAPHTPLWSNTTLPYTETTPLPPPVQMTLMEAPAPEVMRLATQPSAPATTVELMEAPAPVPVPPPVVITLPGPNTLPHIGVSSTSSQY